jgi:hypothetical protein
MCNRITSVIAAAVFAVQLLAASPALPHETASDGTSIDKGHAATGFWSLVASMQVPRQSHQAVRLKTGIVLVVGGSDNQTSSLASAEFFNPRTGEWTFAPSMLEPRYDFAATRLPNGEVLVAGGFKTGTGDIAAAELYDPRLNTWRATGSMNMPRTGHTATLLGSGRVLVVGGFGEIHAEVYDPRTGTWTPTGPMHEVRFLHTATLLFNGTVLVAGGGVAGGSNPQGATASAEIYNPRTNTWQRAPDMSTPRIQHGAVLLHNGTALVSGGCCFLDSAERYLPRIGAWVPAGSLDVPRFGHNPIVLRTGAVLASGGCCEVIEENSGDDAVFRIYHEVEAYSARRDTWHTVARMNVPRHGHEVTALGSGRILVTGGANSVEGVVASAEVFTPSRRALHLEADAHAERAP